MKTRHIAMFAGLLFIAYAMSGCIQTTTTLPDGSVTTTSAPDPVIWGAAVQTAGEVAKAKVAAEVIPDKP